MRTVREVLSISALVVLTAVGSAWAWTTPVPLGGVNTRYGEGWPMVSSDGLTLYFQRWNTSEHYWNQLYQATRSAPSGAFTNVTQIPELAYDEGHLGIPWISPDNLRLYYYRTEPDGGNGTWRMKVSTRATASSPWGAGQNVTELNNMGQAAEARLSADELTVVFNIFPYSGNTGALWTASRSSIGSAFTNIRAVTELNTSDVRANFLSSDGLSLYFSRNDGGIFHLYESTRPSIEGIFGSPELVNFWPDGYGLASFSADGKTAYLGYNGDIYVSQIPEPATVVLVGLGAMILRRLKIKN